MRGRRVSKAAALAACLLLVASSATAADREDELEALRHAIEERRERVAAYERQEQGLFETIEAVDLAARAVAAEVAHAEREARLAARELQEVEARLGALQARVARTQHALGRRAVALYKAGDLGPVRMVFGAGTLRDRLARIQALQLLLDHDQELLQRYDEERRDLEQTRQAAQEAAQRRDAAVAQLAQRQTELQQERRARRDLLEGVRRDRARERALLRELEAAARALEEKIADLQSGSDAPPRGFSELRGDLDPPVPGGVLRGFGRVVDAEYRTETFRKGIDFAVEPGEAVVAVADAEVRFADWFRGYGQVVILDHGGGYFTVSGHLEDFEVEVGESVMAGQAVGTAGETGSLTGPRLYFEIRQGAEALDPADWLRLVPDL